MFKPKITILFILLQTCLVFSQKNQVKKTNIYIEDTSATLLWSDEFDTDGAVDVTKWFHQTQLPNGGSWYNGEIQHYTNRIENTSVLDGVLSIKAKKENFTDQGHTKTHTSARLNSKYAFQYGRVAIRAKLPTGAGTWPAIWMLGKNIIEPGAYWSKDHGTVTWPRCGEIDIMEHWGSNQNYIQSAMHTPSSYGGTINHGGQTIPTASSEFHVYELDWNAERMIFSVDGITHYIYNPEIKDANTWPFDAPQYFLLNVAIVPGISNDFSESSMDIDYVRVYEPSPTDSGDGDSTVKDAATNVYDDFEGNGTINSWAEDASIMDISFVNPYKEGINTSDRVLKYEDIGGQYANIRFDTSKNFDLSYDSKFSLKIYVPGASIEGNQPNQISLKLQDGTLDQPWTTQCEIIKPILLNQWQEVEFDFAKDPYININQSSLQPTSRTDFNRIVLQVNSEDNTDSVIAFIDDFKYNIETLSSKELAISEIQISPNPTKGKITINGDFEKIWIYSITGQKMYDGKSKVLNLEDYAKGIYTLKTQREGALLSTKIIKK
ncbi:MAG: family 16 glycosylhydrolase [Flavicella sp.]